jgi:Uma2 family endonuclease
MYRWFLLLLELYIQKYDTGKIVFQEFGFRLELYDGNISIRIPDIAVVAHDNLVALEDEDNRYNGVYDLCVELISDSYQDIKRDTKIKLREYEAVGVREYFILDAETDYMAFYRLNEFGIYERIKPIEGDIIQSEVLDGFHFRISDLLNTPSLQEIIEDPLYSPFAVPGYMKQKRRAELAEEKAEMERQRAEQEKQRAEQEKRLAEQEKRRAELAELKVEALSAKLRALGETL